MVIFQSPSYSDVMMFDNDARTMLRLMGLSDTVPSALSAEDVPGALERLKQAIENQPVPPAEEIEDDDEDKEPDVPLRHRALPLIELLEAAARDNKHVIWQG